MNLPTPDQRVFLTESYAGLLSRQVCVLKDATDEEILKTCNREDPRTEGFAWLKVIRTMKDLKELDLPEDKSSLPGQCAECPDRLHMIVR